MSNHQKKNFKILIDLLPNRPTNLTIAWPHTYASMQCAFKAFNDVASELMRLGIKSFNLKVEQI